MPSTKRGRSSLYRLKKAGKRKIIFQKIGKKRKGPLMEAGEKGELFVEKEQLKRKKKEKFFPAEGRRRKFQRGKVAERKVFQSTGRPRKEEGGRSRAWKGGEAVPASKKRNIFSHRPPHEGEEECTEGRRPFFAKVRAGERRKKRGRSRLRLFFGGARRIKKKNP